jgi:hypothetical protein
MVARERSTQNTPCSISSMLAGRDSPSTDLEVRGGVIRNSSSIVYEFQRPPPAPAAFGGARARAGCNATMPAVALHEDVNP